MKEQFQLCCGVIPGCPRLMTASMAGLFGT